MPIEIERKFLVKNLDFIKESSHKKSIEQGYLSKDPNRTVRVRIEEEKAFLTIKGKSFDNGTSRIEIEIEISIKDARELMKLCLSSPIKKIRYLINKNGFIFEVDVFKNNNEGLIIAELELNSEKSEFPKPDWLGEEVTGQINTKFIHCILPSIPLSLLTLTYLFAVFNMSFAFIYLVYIWCIFGVFKLIYTKYTKYV